MPAPPRGPQPPRPRWDATFETVTTEDYQSVLDLNYMWVTRGENCPVCEYLSGHILPLSVWQSFVYPGRVHLNCNCLLSRVQDGIPANKPEDVFGIGAYSIYGYDVLKQFAHNFELMFQGKIFSNPAISEVDRLMQAMEKTGSWSEAYNLTYGHPFWDTSLWGLTSVSFRIFQTLQRESQNYRTQQNINTWNLMENAGYQEYKRWWWFGTADTGDMNYLRKVIGSYYYILRLKLPLLFAGFGNTYSATGRVLDPRAYNPAPKMPITTHHYHHLNITDLEQVLYRSY